MNKDRQAMRDIRDSTIEYSGSYMNGSFKDIFMDVIGVSIGAGLRVIIDPYLPESWQYYKDKT